MQFSNAADRHRRLCPLRCGHDATDWQRLSLLHLRRTRAEGVNPLRRLCGLHAQGRSTVIETLSDRTFVRDRLTDLVSGYLEKAKAEAQQQRSQLGQIKADLTKTEGAIKRLLGMVETGLMEVDDRALRESMSVLKAKRKSLTAQLE
jgi:hypothetical protein